MSSDSMASRIERLRCLGVSLLPQGTAAEVDAIRHVLGAPVPDEVRTLYLDHAGALHRGSLAYRLLPPTEATDTISSLHECGLPFADDQLGVFWADDESNYAGVFTAGALLGRVFQIDHDEVSPEPRWRGVASFYDALLDGGGHDGQERHGLRTDYPRRADEAASVDDDVARRCFARYEADPDSDEGYGAAFQAMALSSTTLASRVMELLSSDDPWIQARAAQVLGGWRWADAVGPLAETVRHGVGNAQPAAIRALQQIGTADARRMLDRLRRELDRDPAPYLRW